MSQTPQQQDLEGRTALVTGGASGIGLAAAILVSLLVTIYPAQLASRLRPVDALRYE